MSLHSFATRLFIKLSPHLSAKHTRLQSQSTLKQPTQILHAFFLGSLIIFGCARAQFIQAAEGMPTTTPSPAQTPPNTTEVTKPKHPEHSNSERILKHADKDGDGQISVAEAADHPPLKDQFATLDKNQDGKLSKEELAGLRHPTRAEMQKRMAEKFHAADKNGDGALSQTEAEQAASHMAKHFSEMDTDKNGLVTPEELRAHHQAHAHEQRGEHRMKGSRSDERSAKAGATNNKLPPA